MVIIDYLQVLTPNDPRATDKANTDKAILELKRITRSLDLPIIAISSFNRENYYKPVGLSAFKESGSIEYSCDVLIALQYNGVDDQVKEEETKKHILEIKKDIAEGLIEYQEIQFKVLKNRLGSCASVVLNFYPIFNHFEEAQTDIIF